MKLKSLSLLFFALVFTVSCSEKEDAGSNAEESIKALATESEKKVSSIIISDNIMKPLSGTDICFEAVELVRDEGDIATYRDLGDSIILKKDYVERHGHKTYIGTIGKMIKEKNSIPEIRQVLLNKCRAFKKAWDEQKATQSKAKE